MFEELHRQKLGLVEGKQEEEREEEEHQEQLLVTNYSVKDLKFLDKNNFEEEKEKGGGNEGKGEQ